MSKTVGIDGLADEIAKIFEEFQDATDSVVDESIKKTADEAVKKLKNANPAGSGKYSSWKDYNSGWTQKEDSWSKKRGYHKRVVYNKKKYRLAHLLEHGHALVNGGRAEAFPHIAPVEKFAQKDVVDRIKRGISNG